MLQERRPVSFRIGQVDTRVAHDRIGLGREHTLCACSRGKSDAGEIRGDGARDPRLLDMSAREDAHRNGRYERTRLETEWLHIGIPCAIPVVKPRSSK